MSPEFWIRVGYVIVGLLSAAATGGAVWALLRASVQQLVKDVSSIKQALGLEVVDGRIEPAFITRTECRDHEKRSDRRLEAAEGQLRDHEGRISTLEGQVRP